MDCDRLARQSFGMLKICKNHIHSTFELCLWKKKMKKKEGEKVEAFKFGFSNLLTVGETFGVDVALDY